MNIYQIVHQNTREHELTGKRIVALLKELDVFINIQTMFIQETGVAYQVRSPWVWPSDLAVLPDNYMREIIALLEKDLVRDVTISKQGNRLWIILQDR